VVDVSMSGLGLTKRVRPRTRADDAQQALGRFVRDEVWNGLRAGDVVRIAGHQARGKHWRFRAHVTNTSNGASWVEVSLVDGPPPSRRPGAARADRAGADETEAIVRVARVRSFAPDLISPRWRGRRHRDAQRELAQQEAGQQLLF
jgi:hypothetical protein